MKEGVCGHEQRGERASERLYESTGTANQKTNVQATQARAGLPVTGLAVSSGAVCVGQSARGDSCHNNQQLFFYSIPHPPPFPLTHHLYYSPMSSSLC
jgi:hypothetical protein